MAQKIIRRWAGRLVRLYPRAWRERYAGEMLAVLEDHAVTPWTLIDLVVGAVDAHLHRVLLPREVLSMSQRLRTSAVAIFAAFVIFIVPWALIQRIRDPLADWDLATAAHPEIRASLIALQWAGGIATLALLAGGAPILLAVVRRAIAQRRRDVLLLLSFPLFMIAILALYGWLASPWWIQTRSPGTQILTPLALVLQLGLALLLLVTVVGSAWAVAAAVARAEPDDAVLRFALIPAALLTIAIAIGLLAQIALTVLVLAEAPQLAGPPLGLPFFALLMAAALWIALAALLRGWSATRRRTTLQPATGE